MWLNEVNPAYRRLNGVNQLKAGLNSCKKGANGDLKGLNFSFTAYESNLKRLRLDMAIFTKWTNPNHLIK